jgi:hypothetical protein
VNKLLSFVPDVILIEGNKAFLINPQTSDTPCYAYGDAHPIFEGRYAQAELKPNSVRIEGWNTSTGASLITNVFDWEAIESSYDRPAIIEDRNLGSVTQAQERGEAVLRKSSIAAADGIITVLPNCGQQLYDVIEINDPRAGLSVVKHRVLGLGLSYIPLKSLYRQQIMLGVV